MRVLLFILEIFVCIFFDFPWIGCFDGVAYGAPAYVETKINTYNEDKSQIVVKAQQPVFIIRLKSNPTTGYSWSLLEYNKKLIANMKHRFIVPSHDLIGAPGFEEWTFTMQPTVFKHDQVFTIKFVYSRSWEKNSSEKPVVFEVKVKKK